MGEGRLEGWEEWVRGRGGLKGDMGEGRKDGRVRKEERKIG